MAIVLDTIRTLLPTKQKDNKSHQDYTKGLWVPRDVLKSHIGRPIILTKIVKGMKGYHEKDKT
jgi:hypothetical protein